MLSTRPEDKALALQVAQKVLAEVTKEVISDNDIIPNVELPHFYLNEIDDVREKFGAAAVERYLSYHDAVTALRDRTEKFCSIASMRNPDTTQIIATALMGCGQSSEKAWLAIIKLLENKCPLPIVLIQFMSSRKRPANSHVFLILGHADDPSSGMALIPYLKSVKNCIFFDPLLKIITDSENMLEHIQRYLDIYQLDIIQDAHRITPEHADDLFEIKKQAMNIKRAFAITFGDVFKTIESLKSSICEVGSQYDTSIPFFGKDPLKDLLKKMQEICSCNPTYDIVWREIQKNNFSVAFRKACVGGIIDLAKLFLENQHLLPGFDINATSSNGNTALDWVEESDRPNELKNILISLLEQSGCRRNKSVQPMQL